MAQNGNQRSIMCSRHLLEKLEGFHRAARVGEQNSKVILCDVFTANGQGNYLVF